MSTFPWLTTIGVLPLVGAAAVGLAPRARPVLAKQIALITSLVVLVLTIVMCAQFHARGARFQFVEVHQWIPAFGAQYAVGVDGIALVLVALVAVLTPVVVIASWHDADDVPETAPGPGSTAGTADGRPVPRRRRSVKSFFALLLVLETMMIGVFAATDLFLFYVFFEAMLIPMYFLIGSYGGPRRQYAAVKFLLFSLAGGLLMLAALIGLYAVSADQGQGTFAFDKLVQLHMSTGIQIAIFSGFFIAFAVKAPLWPFHTWLPSAGAEAPVGTAVLLVGVMDKVGTFGFLRYCLPLFPDASRILAPYVLVLCVIGILYGALLAMGQNDMKRLVSYTSVSHFGFIAMGCFAFTTQAQTGAVLYMVNHGLSTGALFLVVGFLISRWRSRLVGDYSGVGNLAPVLSGLFLFAGLSALGLPGISTFVSEFLVLLGTFTTYPAAAVPATIGIILAALYVLLMYQRTMQGPLALPVGVAPPEDWEPYDAPASRDDDLTDGGSEVSGVHEGATAQSDGRGTGVPAGSGPEGGMLDDQPSGGVLTAERPRTGVLTRLSDLRGREVLALAPLVALMLFLGFYPKPVIDVITPAVNATMKDAGRTDPPPTQGTGEPARNQNGQP